MMRNPGSEILTALYHRHLEEASRLAAAKDRLTVWEAAALGAEATLDDLVSANPTLADAVAPDGFTPLTLASFFARPGSVRLLLRHGADPRLPAANDTKVQPLHAAVAGRSMESVQILLAPDVDVNARQQVGYTALMGAASAGRDDVVDQLLARGADPSLVAEDGKTAASVAREHGHHELADRLDSRTP